MIIKDTDSLDVIKKNIENGKLYRYIPNYGNKFVQQSRWYDWIVLSDEEKFFEIIEENPGGKIEIFSRPLGGWI